MRTGAEGSEQVLLDLWKRRRHGGVMRPAEFARRAHAASATRAGSDAAAGLRFGLMFFSAPAPEAGSGASYRLVHEAARIADEGGLDAIWLPERHFHRFGGPYPDPAVLAASLAPLTQRIRLRSGSVIVTLDSPLRIAEKWAMVDNLSGGRVELGVGAGWSPRDFVLAPDSFADVKALFRERLEQVRRLWRGETLAFRDGRGEEASVGVFPRPVQTEPPIWVATTGSAETFRWAGAQGHGVLTMLLGGTLEDVTRNTALYREGRREAGLDPEGGRVALMLHTLVHDDEKRVREAVREPFTDYVRSALDSQRHASEEGRKLTPEEREKMVAFAYHRYTETAALFGRPESCEALLHRVAAAGVTEVACLVDFGVPEELALEGVERLARMAQARGVATSAPRTSTTPHAAAAPPTAEPVAIIGMAGRFPGAADPDVFWENVVAGVESLTPPPAGRRPTDKKAALGLGGFIDGIDLFEPQLFRIAPAEAAVMDPHQRLMLEAVRSALEDAGLAPDQTRGQPVGVFVAMYANGWAARGSGSAEELDPLAVTGSVRSMTANRVSFVFDWSGPSELVDTACSSGLVAVHRAVQALRSGECTMAVAGGVSLLLADEESAGLRELGVLSPDGRCRAFDGSGSGQARGEGVGAVVLKKLADAQRDGDPIHAVIRGTAVNHSGGRSASPTLPHAGRQAECILAAWRSAGVGPGDVGYIEAHGAGTAAGDLVELKAWTLALESLAEADEAGAPDMVIGSVKPNIGSLDAAGGIASLVKAVQALRHRRRPPLINFEGLDEEGPSPAAQLRFAKEPGDWPAPVRPDGRAAPRHAAVHAYGLGGVNAHVVLAEPPPLAAASAAEHAEVVVVSARTVESLRSGLERLRHALTAGSEAPRLADVAYTLRVGREAMARRWATVAHSAAELVSTIDAWLAGRPARVMADGADKIEAASDPVDAAAWAVAQSFVAGGRPDWTALMNGHGARRIHLPGYAFSPQRFPLDPAEAGENAAAPGNPVADFYNFVTRAEQLDEDEVYLTLAPFPEIVEGFSWTSTIQDPERHPAHHAMLLARQREMRAVMLANVDFERVAHVHDIGCGLGSDLIVLARRHPHLTASGYTLSEAQAAAATQRIARRGLAERARAFCRNSAKEPLPRKADLVIGVEVAHHVEDKDGLFANIRAGLSDSGRLVLADTIAATVAPIALAEVGSFTWPKEDYAALFARHGLEITTCIDVSQEIANFLHDPGLDAMLEREAAAAVRAGRDEGVDLAVKVQRSWDAFGEALRTGLVHYVLVEAVPSTDPTRALAQNRQQVGLS